MNVGNFYTRKLWAHIKPNPSIKSSFKIKSHDFCEVSINVRINQVKKTNKDGNFGLDQEPIDTNILIYK